MKTILNGLLVGITMLLISVVYGFASNKIAPSLQNEYQNSSVFRPWSDPRMSLMWLHPFTVGILLAWIWSGIWKAIPGETFMMKGLSFSLTWFLLSIPGMIMSYASFEVSGTMVLSWTLNNFFQALSTGYILSRIFRKKELTGS